MDARRLDLLEQKIRAAAAMIRSLREEKASLTLRLAQAAAEIEDLRARAAGTASAALDEEGHKELQALRRERREVLARVDKMLALLDEAAALSDQEDLLAAVDGAD